MKEINVNRTPAERLVELLAVFAARRFAGRPSSPAEIILAFNRVSPPPAHLGPLERSELSERQWRKVVRLAGRSAEPASPRPTPVTRRARRSPERRSVSRATRGRLRRFFGR